MAPLVDLVNSCSELSVEEQQGDALPLDHASFPYSSDNFRVPYIVTNFRKNTEESVGLEAMIIPLRGVIYWVSKVTPCSAVDDSIRYACACPTGADFWEIRDIIMISRTRPLR